MNLPADFISSLRSLPGEETELLLSALQEDAPVSIRLNPVKQLRNPHLVDTPAERVPWSDHGFYLEERPPFTFDPHFHSGYYYVQEASSMFIEYLVRKLIPLPVICLDLCAAPGGKSVSLLSALPEESLLVSNELIRQRANVLSETLIKYGDPNVVVTNNHPVDFRRFPALFDLVLVDAPCSGEGMFRKDATAIEEWSLHNVAMCAVRQKDILRDVWPALKPGGLLIYSTCTYNQTENENNALWIAQELGATFVEVEVQPEWGIAGSLHNEVSAYRFFPHKTKGEGLFVTILRKNESDDEASLTSRKESHKNRKESHSKNDKRSSPYLKEETGCGEMLLHPAQFQFIEADHRIIALPTTFASIIHSLKEGLKVVSMGIETGVKKGKDFIPSHALAMSRELRIDACTRYEVTYLQAIAFLRKEALQLAEAPTGYLLLTFQQEPIGWVKNIGNRANNLYPNEWRIRSGYLPGLPNQA